MYFCPKDRPFNSTYAEPPSNEAVLLLAESDILVNLGEVFVATVDEVSTGEEEDERLRHERIENVSAAIVGLTRRVLQLEQAHYSMPENLNVFKNPGTIGNLLDASLNGDSEGEKVNRCSTLNADVRER